MSFDPIDTASRAASWEWNTIKDSGKTVWSNTGSADFFNKPGVAVAEIGKEALLLPARNILKIMSMTGTGVGKLLFGTLKWTGKALLALPWPMPLPNGCKSLAEVGWQLNVVKNVLAEKARGNPQAFGPLFKSLSGTIENVRNAAETRATTGSTIAA